MALLETLRLFASDDGPCGKQWAMSDFAAWRWLRLSRGARHDGAHQRCESWLPDRIGRFVACERLKRFYL